MRTPLFIGGFPALDGGAELLHESTSPAAVAADQRLAVAAALAAHPRGSPEMLSGLVVLPVSVVRRRLTEIRGDDAPPPRQRARLKAEAVAAWLKANGPAGLDAIAAGLPASRSAVHRCLRGPFAGDYFKHAGVTVNHRNKPRRLWASRA